jgi:hypothetical protein
VKALLLLLLLVAVMLRHWHPGLHRWPTGCHPALLLLCQLCVAGCVVESASMHELLLLLLLLLLAWQQRPSAAAAAAAALKEAAGLLLRCPAHRRAVGEHRNADSRVGCCRAGRLACLLTLCVWLVMMTASDYIQREPAGTACCCR